MNAFTLKSSETFLFNVYDAFFPECREVLNICRFSIVFCYIRILKFKSSCVDDGTNMELVYMCITMPCEWGSEYADCISYWGLRQPWKGVSLVWH